MSTTPPATLTTPTKVKKEEEEEEEMEQEPGTSKMCTFCAFSTYNLDSLNRHEREQHK